MKARQIILSLGAFAASSVAMPVPAEASTGMAIWPLALVSIYPEIGMPCDRTATPTPPAGFSNKVTALLGGQPSSLERIRLQQAGVASAPNLISAASSLPVASAAQAQGLTMPATSVATGCAGFVSAAPRLEAMTAQPKRALLNPDDFLGSRRLAVQHTDFDSAWERVRSHGLSHQRVAELTGIPASSDSEHLLLAVNSWVNRRIRYVDDQTQYGRADYWGTAAATLKRAEGDCEDIAIVKLQMLAALGIPQDRMFLTIARDQVRGGDHALLIVNINGSYRMLDDSTDTVLDGRQANDYMPIMSFSANRKWLHGF